MPANQFQQRRVRWAGRPVEVIAYDLCDDLDELEVQVTLDVGAARAEIAQARAEQKSAIDTIRKQQWAILLAILGGMVSLIVVLLSAK